MKNRGYSLIELIVVVAMIAIAGSILFLSINTKYALEMRQCAKTVNSALAKVKIDTLSKTGNVCLHLYTQSDGVYMDIWENGTKLEETNDLGQINKIGKKTVGISYTVVNTETNQISIPIPLDDTGIVIAFNRSDGSLKTIGAALDIAKESYGSTYTPPNPDDSYNSITFTGAGSSMTITLHPDTGKFELS